MLMKTWALVIFQVLLAAVLGAQEPLIAAASDLKPALEELAEVFQQETGQKLKLVFGSSGNFATQIQNGAPFDLFLSADESYVFQLHGRGLTPDRGVLYALGRIVILAPLGSKLQVDPHMEGLKTLIQSGQLKRFSIANPQHAPYGKRAQEALTRAGLWDAVTPHLVFGENVSQAAQFTLSGSVEGGIIALSLALSPQVQKQGRYALIPETWHQPLLQRMVLLKKAGPEARAFYEYLQSASARRLMEKHGFALPSSAAE